MLNKAAAEAHVELMGKSYIHPLEVTLRLPFSLPFNSVSKKSSLPKRGFQFLIKLSWQAVSPERKMAGILVLLSRLCFLTIMNFAL